MKGRTEDTNEIFSVDEAFDLFWRFYPRRQKKVAAKRVWAKIPRVVSHLYDILAAIEKQKKSAQWQDLRFVPLPSTWLFNHQWEDEVMLARPEPPPPRPVDNSANLKWLARLEAKR